MQKSKFKMTHQNSKLLSLLSAFERKNGRSKYIGCLFQFLKQIRKLLFVAVARIAKQHQPDARLVC